MFSDGYIGDTYFDVKLVPDVVLCRLAEGNKDAQGCNSWKF